MIWRKIFRRAAIILFAGIFLATAAVVGAKIQMYTATGEDYANEVESQDIAKLRARDKAIKKATKQAGVYLKTYSRSVNSELTDDEIIAITSNSWQLVGEPKYSRTVKQISDETSIIVWTATVEVNVDDSELQNWIKRDAKEKSTIINQTRKAQKVSDENERIIEDLREKYNRATSQAEKDSLRKQMNDADRDFLANQKHVAGIKLYYANDFNGAIKLYNEALQLNPNNADVYIDRGNAYFDLGQYERAIQDYNKTIKLRSDYSEAYNNRARAYEELGQYNRAFQDYTKAIELNPNYALCYYNRGLASLYQQQYRRAIPDFTKVIELESKPDKIDNSATYGLADVYNNRGVAYKNLEQYENALKDYNKAIELNPNQADAYLNRAVLFIMAGNYNQALADLNKTLQINPNRAQAYYLRGLIYAEMGNTAKAQADLTRAQQLGFNG